MKDNSNSNKRPNTSKNIRVLKLIVYKYILLLLVILRFSDCNLLSLNDGYDKKKYDNTLGISTLSRTYFVLTIDGILWSINNNGRILWKRRLLDGGTFYPNKIFVDKKNINSLPQTRLYCSFQGNIFYGSTIEDTDNFYNEHKDFDDSIFSDKSILPRGLIPINDISISDLVERCPFHSSLFPGLYLTGSRNSDILTIDLFTGRIISNSVFSQQCEIYNNEPVLESKIYNSIAIGITSWKIMAMNILTNRIEWNIRYSDISGLNDNNDYLRRNNLLDINKIGGNNEYQNKIYFGSSRSSLYFKNTSLNFDSIISKVFVLREGVSLPYIPSNFFYIEQIEVERYPDYSNSAVGPLININNVLLNEFTHYLSGDRYNEIGYLIRKKLIELSPIIVDIKKIMSQPLLPLPVYQNNSKSDKIENLKDYYLNGTDKISKISVHVNRNHLTLITGILLFIINIIFFFVLLAKKRSNSKGVMRNNEEINENIRISKCKEDLKNSFLVSYSNLKSEDADENTSNTQDDKYIRISKSHSMVDMRTNFIGFSKDAFFKALNYKTGNLDSFGNRSSLDENNKQSDIISDLKLPECSSSNITTNIGTFSQRASMQTSISTANTPKNSTLICSTPLSASSGPKSSSLYNIPQKCELARCIDNGRFSKNFEICKLIGSGGFGQVYQVEHKLERGTYYAIKFLRLGIGANDDITRIRYFREITANRTTLSKHVVRYYTWWCEEPEALQNYVDGIDSLGCSKSASNSSIQPIIVDNRKSKKKKNKNLKLNEKNLNRNSRKSTVSNLKHETFSPKEKIFLNQENNISDYLSSNSSSNSLEDNLLNYCDDDSGVDSFLSRAPFEEEDSNFEKKGLIVRDNKCNDYFTSNASNERYGAISLASNSSIDNDYNDSQDLNFIAFENDSNSIDFTSNDLHSLSRKEENNNEEIQDNGLLYRTRTMTPSISSVLNNEFLPLSSKYDQNSQNIVLSHSGISSIDRNSCNHHRSLVYLSPGNRREDEPIYEVIMMIQMELCVGVTLRSWLGDSSRSTEYGGTEVELNMFKQIMKGIRDIHEKGIVHRDLKPENIFVNPNTLQIKIGDFGLARLMFDGETNENKINAEIVSPKVNNKGINNELNRFMEESKRKKVDNAFSRLDSQMSVRGQVIGTPGYTAPEGGALCNEKADIYSAALILLELLCPRFTTAMERIHILDDFRSKGIVPTCIMKNHDSWIPLLRSMTYQDPEFRPSAENTYRIVKDLIKKCGQK